MRVELLVLNEEDVAHFLGKEPECDGPQRLLYRKSLRTLCEQDREAGMLRQTLGIGIDHLSVEAEKDNRGQLYFVDKGRRRYIDKMANLVSVTHLLPQ